MLINHLSFLLFIFLLETFFLFFVNKLIKVLIIFFVYLNIVKKKDAKKVTITVNKTIIAPIATPGPP